MLQCIGKMLLIQKRASELVFCWGRWRAGNVRLSDHPYQTSDTIPILVIIEKNVFAINT